MILEEDLRHEYVNAQEAAHVLNVTTARIRQNCITGRFHGAFKIGNAWLIPRVSIKGYPATKLKPGPKTKRRKEKTDREIISQAIEEAQRWK